MMKPYAEMLTKAEELDTPDATPVETEVILILEEIAGFDDADAVFTEDGADALLFEYGRSENEVLVEASKIVYEFIFND